VPVPWNMGELTLGGMRPDERHVEGGK
jgi:hypothetical protein